jgi:hypothetical protein
VKKRAEKRALCGTTKGMSLQREPEGQGAHARMTGGGGGGKSSWWPRAPRLFAHSHC